VPRDRQLAELIRSQIGFMVNDLLAETTKRIEGLGSVDDIRAAGRASAAFSSELAAQERAFKRFMYEKLYYHPEQIETARRAKSVIAELFSAYSQQPVLMDEEWIDGLPRHEPERSRHIADYIAGMTDRFAIARHADIYGVTPERLRNV
jgi:dGTPase